MIPDRPDAPAWQRNPLFRFFASLQLAMLLLTVLTLASIIGTLCESRFDAKVARAYIYGAAWFNVWLLLLVINLVCSAFSRYPWKKHHFAFLITHLGIILLIAGAWIGRAFGVEGTMTLFKGDPPANMLTVDQRILRVSAGEADPQTTTFEILNKPPTPENPRSILTTPSGYQLSAVGFSPSLEMSMTPTELSDGGVPAVHVSIATAMMGQKLDSWLIADDPDHGVFSMGLATISLKRGAAAPSAPAADLTTLANPATAPAADIEEAIFAFANMPDQISHPEKGGATGAKVKLINVAPGSSGTVVIDCNGSSQSFDVQSNLNKDVPIPGTPFTLSIKNYWPDFRIKDGKPGTLSQNPNNPAVLVFLTGHAIPAAAIPAHAGTSSSDSPPAADAPPPMSGPPPLGSGVAALNHLILYVDAKGQLTYELASRKAGASSGKIDPGTPLPTGWADWKLTIDRFIPHAREHFTARPAPADFKGPRSEGLKIRAVRGSESVEEWVPLGWQVALSTTPLQIAYGYKELPLPIGLRLTNFEVERNEGTDSPAGFKSTVEILDGDGSSTTGQCWMNNPISYPSSWLNTFSGFTYKISQASWNPDNLNQSTVQILRDPGWSLKWIGSLCIVAGVFSLFYLRPDPENLQRAPGSRESSGKTTRKKSSRVPVEV